MKLEKRQQESNLTPNQKAMIKAMHISDQETGQALVIEPRPTNQYGVFK